MTKGGSRVPPLNVAPSDTDLHEFKAYLECATAIAHVLQTDHTKKVADQRITSKGFLLCSLSLSLFPLSLSLYPSCLSPIACFINLGALLVLSIPALNKTNPDAALQALLFMPAEAIREASFFARILCVWKHMATTRTVRTLPGSIHRICLPPSPSEGL